MIFIPLGSQMALEVLQGLKYDDPPLPGVEHSMAHPIWKAENIATHPLCAPTHPSYTY